MPAGEEVLGAESDSQGGLVAGPDRPSSFTSAPHQLCAPPGSSGVPKGVSKQCDTISFVIARLPKGVQVFPKAAESTKQKLLMLPSQNLGGLVEIKY